MGWVTCPAAQGLGHGGPGCAHRCAAGGHGALGSSPNFFPQWLAVFPSGVLRMPLQPSSPWSPPHSPLPSHPALASLAPQVRIVLEELDLSTLPLKEEGPPEAGTASPAGKPPRPKKPRGEGTPKGTPKRRPPLPPARVGDSTAGSHNAGASLLDQLDMLASAAEAAGDFASPDQRAGGAAAAAAAAGQATDPGEAGQAPFNGGNPVLGRLGSGGSTAGGSDGGVGSVLDPQVAAAAARKLRQRAVEAFAAAGHQSADSMLRPFKLLLRAQPGSALFKVGAGRSCFSRGQTVLSWSAELISGQAALPVSKRSILRRP